MFLNGAGLSAQMEMHNALGRSDLEFTDGVTRRALEFKHAHDKSRKEDPKSLLKKGLDQIDERMYGRQSGEKWLKSA